MKFLYTLIRTHFDKGDIDPAPGRSLCSLFAQGQAFLLLWHGQILNGMLAAGWFSPSGSVTPTLWMPFRAAAIQPPHWRDQWRVAVIETWNVSVWVRDTLSHVCLNAWPAAVFETMGPLQGRVLLEEVGYWVEGQNFIIWPTSCLVPSRSSLLLRLTQHRAPPTAMSFHYDCVLWDREPKWFLHLLLFQKLRVQFSALTLRFITTHRVSSRGTDPSSDLHRHQAHTWCTYIHAGKHLYT